MVPHGNEGNGSTMLVLQMDDDQLLNSSHLSMGEIKHVDEILYNASNDSLTSMDCSPPVVATEVSTTYSDNGIHQPSINTFYVQVEENDVLFGRGSRAKSHLGNKEYLRCVLNFQRAYKILDYNGKKALIKVVVQWVDLRGGRFLAYEKNHEGHGRYYVASHKEVHEKVSQALREDHTPEGRALKKSRQK